MIDITPYLNKLTILQGFINLNVDGKIPVLKHKILIQEGMRTDTNLCDYILNPPIKEVECYRPMTFEEYYNHKTNG